MAVKSVGRFSMLQCKYFLKIFSRGFILESATSISQNSVIKGDTGQMVSVAKNDLKSVFVGGGGLSKHLQKEMELFNHVSWLMRKESSYIIEKLASQDQKGRKVLLYGENGCGKTTVLCQVLHYLVRNGWTCLHVPGVFKWVHSLNELRPSFREDGSFDQPDQSLKLLRSFKSLNSANLADVKLSMDYSWSPRERSSAGDNLLKVIDMGLLKPQVATEIVGGVVKELTNLAESRKIAFVIDEYNGLYNPTTMKATPEASEYLLPEKLNLVKFIREATSCVDLHVVGALSKVGMKRHYPPSSLPKDILGSTGVAEAAEFENVFIPPFSYSELKAYISYLYEIKWFTKSDLNEGILKQIWTLTTGNPRELQKLCIA